MFLGSLSLFLVATAGCAGRARPRGEAAPLPRPGATAVGGHGMVVSVSAPASAAGRDVLRQGGNAVDAAVATAFALAVTFPEAGNIGGGGFMLVHPGRRAGAGPAEPVVIDYRETAPDAATADMFAAADAAHPPSSESMVGVPGTVRGLALAHRKFGRLKWDVLVAPAVRLARDGFEVDADLAAALNAALARAGNFPDFRRTFAPPRPGAPWQAGDRLVQPDLARTLERIGRKGEAAFYAGPVARAIAGTVREGSRGGVLTEQDLADYRAKVRPAVHGRFREFDVYGPPPPSSGGVAVVEMLNILESFDLRRDGRWSPRTLHRMVEAMRRAFVDRATFLGDSDLDNVPAAGLTSKLYAGNLAAGIDDHHASSSEKLAAAAGITIEADPAESPHTTHFSVIDADGIAVSNTYTLEQAFGGMLVVNGCGFLLNNEMGDFNPRPGHTDATGRIGTPPNVLRPGKRMLSSMCPTVVARDGKVVLVTGSPGGRTIINTVLCVVLNVLEFEMPLREAVDAPRLHHQWLPDTIAIETALRTGHPEAVEGLRRLGHVIAEKSPRQGDAHSIAVKADGTYLGVADTRRSGAAAGY